MKKKKQQIRNELTNACPQKNSQEKYKKKSERMDVLLIITLIISIIIILSCCVCCCYCFAKIGIKPHSFPPNHIKNWHKTRKNANFKRFVCVGDSNTHGIQAVPYCDILSEKLISSRIQVINAGINGNTVYHVSERLPEILSIKPDFISILIGTNDAICIAPPSPFMQKMLHKTIPPQFHPSLANFASQLRNLVIRIQTASPHTKICLISTPIVGNELGGDLYQALKDISNIIKSIAGEFRLVYVPLFEEQTKIIVQNYFHLSEQNTPNYLRLIFRSLFKHFLFGTNLDTISEENQFPLSIEGIHLNSKSANLVASLILENFNDLKQFGDAKVNSNYIYRDDNSKVDYHDESSRLI